MYRGATDSNLLRNEDAALRQVTDVEDERTTDKQIINYSSLKGPPTCSRVGRILAPCTGFLNGQEPTSLCCSSVKKLHDAGKTKNDRVAICNCIKQVTKSIPYDAKRIPLMSTKCGVKPEFPPIDKNYNCAAVK
uniref:Non-specific lipid-transfer protein n=1 Tax=Helianthus annuus TaxID=4232 RepID=A0A251RTG5_HELAN